MSAQLAEFGAALAALADVLRIAQEEHQAAPVVGMSGITLQRFDAAMRRLNEVVAAIESPVPE